MQSDDGWGHFLENKRVMSLRYYDYSARSAESCAVRRRSSFFFFTGHASVKKMPGALEGTHVDRESSNRKMKHDIRSRQERNTNHMGEVSQFGNDSEDSLFIDGNNCFLLWD